MKIAISTSGAGLDAPYNPRFGRAAQFCIIDDESDSLEIIPNPAINAAGGTLEDVVRTRMFVSDIAHWEAIGRAHGEFFREIKPASTMVQVSTLISPELLVEIEATAWLVA